jgi:hypothetical protein
MAANPRVELARLFRFVGLDPGYAAAAAQPHGDHPDVLVADVRRARQELEPYLGRTEEFAARARDWLAIGGNSDYVR